MTASVCHLKDIRKYCLSRAVGIVTVVFVCHVHTTYSYLLTY